MSNSRSIRPIGLRLPEQLREWVRDAAYRERRSVNAQLTHIVERAMDAAGTEEKKAA